MKCNKCGAPGAYLGLNDMDCCNTRCRHYQPDFVPMTTNGELTEFFGKIKWDISTIVDIVYITFKVKTFMDKRKRDLFIYWSREDGKLHPCSITTEDIIYYPESEFTIEKNKVIGVTPNEEYELKWDQVKDGCDDDLFPPMLYFKIRGIEKT